MCYMVLCFVEGGRDSVPGRFVSLQNFLAKLEVAFVII